MQQRTVEAEQSAPPREPGRPPGTSIGRHHAALHVVDRTEMQDLALGDPIVAQAAVLHHAPAAMSPVFIESLPAAHERGRKLRWPPRSPDQGTAGRHCTRSRKAGPRKARRFPHGKAKAAKSPAKSPKVGLDAGIRFRSGTRRVRNCSGSHVESTSNRCEMFVRTVASRDRFPFGGEVRFSRDVNCDVELSRHFSLTHGPPACHRHHRHFCGLHGRPWHDRHRKAHGTRRRCRSYERRHPEHTDRSSRCWDPRRRPRRRFPQFLHSGPSSRDRHAMCC